MYDLACINSTEAGMSEVVGGTNYTAASCLDFGSYMKATIMVFFSVLFNQVY